MGPRMIILFYVLIVYADHIKGVPETHGQSLTTDNQRRIAPAAEEPLTTATPIKKERPQAPPCKCKGKEKVLANTQCLCHKAVGFKRKSTKWRKLCQRKKFKDTKKCLRFKRKETKVSVPI